MATQSDQLQLSNRITHRVLGLDELAQAQNVPRVDAIACAWGHVGQWVRVLGAQVVDDVVFERQAVYGGESVALVIESLDGEALRRVL